MVNNDMKSVQTFDGVSVGDKVVDLDGHEGIVVKIIPGYDDEEHGTIFVWQLNRVEYGVDNCEHYPAFNCRRCLRIVELA
jgi:hypothetical protein